MNNTAIFYSNIKNNDEAIEVVKNYSEQSNIQSYVIDRILSTNDNQYNYNDAYLILIPNHKMIFVNKNVDKKEEFDNFVLDFTDDIGSQISKYSYQNYIGRARAWRDVLIEKINEVELSNTKFEDLILQDDIEKRKTNILISLIIGSINDAATVGEKVPTDILEHVKRKIILFDADQTRFIFDKSEQKSVSIQGLAGTGKTELLLHKLKELYLDEDNKIVLTCYHQVLENSLRKRVPSFFSSMKVTEQIKWNERLWVMRGWGSEKNKNTGVYCYITNNYEIPFQNFREESDFSKVCSNAIEHINHLKESSDFEHCFDYILIDESQDFPDSFFELCKLVTKKTVYIAGDIFQKINDQIPNTLTTDYLLNRCYRTDNRTLMFAHSVGFGFFEEEAIRWFTNKEFNSLGYNIDDESFFTEKKTLTLSRKPLRRFDDIDDNHTFTELIRLENRNPITKVIDVIKKIKNENPTLKPEDIAIVFVEPSQSSYQLIDSLINQIDFEFGWESNRGFTSKKVKENSIFITNSNNIKGLEFPFIICIANNGLNQKISTRNILYMTLTRSFISSYLLLFEKNNELFDVLNDGLKSIEENNKLIITEPESVIDKNKLDQLLTDSTLKSQYEIFEEIFDNMLIDENKRSTLKKIVKSYDNNIMDPEKIKQIINANKGLM